MVTKRQRWYAGATVLLLWFVGATVVDRFVILPHLSALSNVLYLQNLELAAEPFKRTFDRLGLFVLLVIPSMISSVGVGLLTLLRFRQRLLWKEALVLSAASAFWFLLIPFIVWAGHMLYKMAGAVLGEVTFLKAGLAFFETFKFKCSIYVLGFWIADLDASLAALLGAAVGILLAYRQGVWKPWFRKLRGDST